MVESGTIEDAVYLPVISSGRCRYIALTRLAAGSSAQGNHNKAVNMLDLIRLETNTTKTRLATRMHVSSVWLAIV
jgi:hypothetical protein